MVSRRAIKSSPDAFLFRQQLTKVKLQHENVLKDLRNKPRVSVLQDSHRRLGLDGKPAQALFPRGSMIVGQTAASVIAPKPEDAARAKTPNQVNALTMMEGGVNTG